jgi:MYXO-CTERM domain-containing protein
MRLSKRFLSIAALGAITASIAHAQIGRSGGEADTSVSFSSSAAGFAYSFYSSARASYTDTGSFYNSGEPLAGGSYAQSFADGGSIATPSGSSERVNIGSDDWVSVINRGLYDDTLYLTATTQAGAYAYASGRDASSGGYAYSKFYDSDGLIDEQYVLENAVVRPGGDRYDWDLSGVFSYGQLVGVYHKYQKVYPAELSTQGYATEAYALTLAPGEMDTFYLVANSGHTSAATTPGPAAVASFALGLLGARRRRNRRDKSALLSSW